MEYVYKTKGTCSTNIELNVEDGVVKEVAFWGGCNGNLQGISRLVRGMKVADVIAKLERSGLLGRMQRQSSRSFAPGKGNEGGGRDK